MLEGKKFRRMKILEYRHHTISSDTFGDIIVVDAYVCPYWDGLSKCATAISLDTFP
jgi:hypothetical protein